MVAILAVTLSACQPSPPARGTPAAASATGPSAAPDAELGPAQRVGEFAFVPGSRDLAFSTIPTQPEEPVLYVQRWDAAAGGLQADAETLARLPEPARRVNALSGGESGPVVALGGTAPEAPSPESDVWTVGADGAVKPLGVAALRPYQVTLAPEGNRLAILDGEGRLLVRDLATGAEQPLRDGVIADYGGPGGLFAFAPDGQSLVLVTSEAGVGSTVERFDVADGSRTVLLQTSEPVGIDALAFDPDDGALYYITSKSIVGGPEDLGSSFDSILYRLAPTAGAKPERIGAIADMIGRKNLVNSLAVAPGGRILVVQNDTIYTIDPAVASARALTPPEEEVYGAPLLTTVDGKTWVGYRAARQSPDSDESISELRVRPLE